MSRKKAWYDHATPEELRELAEWMNNEYGLVLRPQSKSFTTKDGRPVCDVCHKPPADGKNRIISTMVGGCDVCWDCYHAIQTALYPNYDPDKTKELDQLLNLRPHPTH